MSNKNLAHHLVELPASRRSTPALIDLITVKHCMYGLLEVDVTIARRFMAEHKARTGETLSFTGYLVFCLARAVDLDKSVQAYMSGSKRLVIFDDVDVGMAIEREMGGTRVPVGHVIRGANHKTFEEIHREIRKVQTEPVPPGKGMPRWVHFFLVLPGPLSRLFTAIFRAFIRRDPAGTLSVPGTAGTVGITAVGMFGHANGWALTPAAHSLDLVVGSIARKPAYVNDCLEPREFLNLTVVMDHDVVDGAPASRFVSQLVNLVESGSGLTEFTDARGTHRRPSGQDRS